MTEGERRPARGYRWEDAKPGNTLALKHGVYSPRTVNPLAQALVDQVLEQAGAPGSSIAYLSDVTFRPALWDWAQAEVRLQLLVEWVDQRADGTGVTDEGEELGASRALDRARARAMTCRQRLGMDPLSRMRLGRDLVAVRVDLAQLMAAEAGGDDAA